MIEKYTKDEVKQIIEELKQNGYEIKENGNGIKENGKGRILLQEAEAIGLHNLYIRNDLNTAIFTIADWVTDNYTKKTPKGEGAGRTYKKKTVSADKEEQYRKICKGILLLIADQYGRAGFRDRDVFG